MSESDIAKANCKWIRFNIMKLESLISYESSTMIDANKSMALSAIGTMEDSLRELRAYIEEQ